MDEKNNNVYEDNTAVEMTEMEPFASEETSGVNAGAVALVGAILGAAATAVVGFGVKMWNKHKQRKEADQVEEAICVDYEEDSVDEDFDE